jgi:putative transposase
VAIPVTPERYPRCQHPLGGEALQPPRHQVTEIPPVRPVITAYQWPRLVCPVCGEVTRADVPAGVATGGFGPRGQAMAALCTRAYHLSKRTTQSVLADPFGLSMSLGTVANLEHATVQAVAAPGALVEPLLPPATQSPRGGRPRQGDRRDVRHAMFSLTRRGGQGELRPHDGRPQRTVNDDLAQGGDDGTWATLVQAGRAQTRVHAGREPTPSAACLESQAVQTTARGGPERGNEGGKTSPGRQRQVWVATLGLGLAMLMTRAGLDDGVAAPPLLGHLTPGDVPPLRTIGADQTSHQHTLEAWRAAHRAGWRIAVTTRPEGTTGFTPLETRGVMEGTNAWPGRSRSNSKDDERHVESRTAMIPMSPGHLMLKRLAPCRGPLFHDRQDAAYDVYDRAGRLPDSL